MGAAASTNGARELRTLHNAITASGISTIHTTLADSTSPMVRIERLAERLIINETLLTKIDSVEPSNKTTLMYAAASAGGEETLAVIKLLQKHTKNREEFLRSVSWRNPSNGLTVLHVCKDGKAAALLLRCGCRNLEDREFINGFTPLQLAAQNDNVDLVAVLHAWGASNEGTQTCRGRSQRATDISLFNTVPERPHGNMCWLVLNDLIPLTRFNGIQYMRCRKIEVALKGFGIDVVVPLIPSASRKRLLEDSNNSSTTDTNGIESFAEKRRDEMQIQHLPIEYQKDAYLFDTDNSGTINVLELKKIVRSKERLRKSEGDHDILADSNRVNAFGGGDVLIQCQQRGLHHHDETHTCSRAVPEMDFSYNPNDYEEWHDPDSFVQKVREKNLLQHFHELLSLLKWLTIFVRFCKS